MGILEDDFEEVQRTGQCFRIKEMLPKSLLKPSRWTESLNASLE
jgi:hypothetical protein